MNIGVSVLYCSYVLKKTASTTFGKAIAEDKKSSWKLDALELYMRGATRFVCKIMGLA